MKKYLNIIKNFLACYYGYIIIISVLVYSGMVLFSSYQNIYSIYDPENITSDINTKVDTNLYKTIIENKKVKQTPEHIENINNPFSPLN